MSDHLYISGRDNQDRCVICRRPQTDHVAMLDPGGPVADSDDLAAELASVLASRDRLLSAIAEHHKQKADDRCIEDDDKLYAAAGLPPCDRYVGDKLAMLANCARFIDRRCEGGVWPSYAELEASRDRLAGELEEAKRAYASAMASASHVNTLLCGRLARCRESLRQFRSWMDAYVFVKDDTGKPHTDEDTRSIFAFIDQCLAETETPG